MPRNDYKKGQRVRLTASGWVATVRESPSSVYLDYEGKMFQRSQVVIRYGAGSYGYDYPLPVSVKVKVERLMERVSAQRTEPD